MFGKITPVLVGLLLLFGLAASFAHAGTEPAVVAKPMLGINDEYNSPMCGTNDWERIKTPLTEFAVSDSTGTCVKSERYHPDFTISAVTKTIGWQYPNLSSGFVSTGESTCASSADTCFDYPVREADDGTPVASFGSWIAGGYQGNESFDIWFSPTESRHSADDRGGDTEVMIWTAYPGIHDKTMDDVTIDGKRFGIMTWEAGHAGTQWRYVAYLWLNAPNGDKGRQVNVSGLWLNPFFRNAESHGWLSSSEWLWAIDFGFEMNRGGATNNVHDYSLTDVK